VRELVTDGERVVGIRGRAAGGAMVTEKARIVIGADGLRSLVARSVQAPTYNVQPTFTCAYYSYWSDVSIQDAEFYPRAGRLILAAPTNYGQTITIVYWPSAAFREVRSDFEGNLLRALDLAPGLAERVCSGTRVEPFRGTVKLPNLYRKPYGPGWALVGDAGYHKDPITAQGISDAFRDAELLAGAIDEGLYERRRNEASLPLFEMSCQFATLQPPSPEQQQLFAALRHDQEQTDRFFGTVVETVPIPEFFAQENVGRIMGAAGLAESA
jgi:flavin-dependent dehydrogenase